MSQDECKKYLRFLELDAYAKIVSALRAQGPLTEVKQKLLENLATVLHISNDRHQAEIRRAVNDDKLSIIAEKLFGPNTDTEWTVEGRRIIPLLTRLKGRTAFTTFANSLSLTTGIANERQPQFQRQKDVKFESESYYDSKFGKKILNNEGENSFTSRKRKRLSQEISALNNGIYTHPSTSDNKISIKILNSTKSFSPTRLIMDQCTTNRQKIENNKLDQCRKHQNRDIRKLS
ncbi:PREDICTED: protein EMSY [Ceratosolen solmsi marchali]|uniref:Protein EMSY n=1 Tax=Ceratosolen solmsi marchali TaxID=326594 RepID=A0AAJ6YVP5_9HYME|nr:PREDICTED: protein EMSY [Ceratosolen solmsi marchali]